MKKINLGAAYGMCVYICSLSLFALNSCHPKAEDVEPNRPNEQNTKLDISLEEAKKIATDQSYIRDTVNAAEYSRCFPFVHYDIKPR